MSSISNEAELSRDMEECPLDPLKNVNEENVENEESRENDATEEIEETREYEDTGENDMAARPYIPISPQRRKRKSGNAKSGRAKMGVGAFLQQKKLTLATECGSLEVDEDTTGNISIDGEPLSFESWGKMTQCNQPDVVSIKQLPTVLSTPTLAVHDLCMLRRGQRARRSFAAKIEMMRKAAAESTFTEYEKEQKEDDRELDEGEIVSEDEIKKKKRKRNSSSSSDSGSSGSSADDGAHNSRKRRSIRRKQLNKKRPTNFNISQNPALAKLFENRHAILAMFPADQRTSFAALLSQMLLTSGK